MPPHTRRRGQQRRCLLASTPRRLLLFLVLACPCAGTAAAQQSSDDADAHIFSHVLVQPQSLEVLRHGRSHAGGALFTAPGELDTVLICAALRHGRVRRGNKNATVVVRCNGRILPDLRADPALAAELELLALPGCPSRSRSRDFRHVLDARVLLQPNDEPGAELEGCVLSPHPSSNVSGTAGAGRGFKASTLVLDGPMASRAASGGSAGQNVKVSRRDWFQITVHSVSGSAVDAACEMDGYVDQKDGDDDEEGGDDDDEDGDPGAELGLLQLSATTRMIPGMAIVLKPVMHVVMDPVINLMANTVPNDLLENFEKLLDAESAVQIPGDVAAMLAQVLVANVTNLCLDAITAKVTDSVATSLVESLGSFLDPAITAAVAPRLETALAEILEASIPSKSVELMPEKMSQALETSLLSTLTRSLTHTLVPTLAKALSHTEHQDKVCAMCFHYRMYCERCHYGTQSGYYSSYYATYYADYYSEYYAKYYGDAVQSIQLGQVEENPKNTKNTIKFKK